MEENNLLITENKTLPNDIFFITSQELEDMYPDKKPKEREDLITKEKEAAFIMKIGNKLKSGIAHDGRSPDYDDWELNGDIILWYEPLNIGFELSSMGIRVDREALKYQLKKRGCKNIRFLCIIAAPEGLKKLQDAEPDVDIYVGALDDHLNDIGYIVPGLGDAGDRIFGTK